MKRLLTGALAVAMAVSFVAPLSAGAATIAELQAQIALLTAQLSALSGGSSSAGYTFTMDLTVGSKGADVTALQNWLIGKGYSIPAGATGYFGSQTKAAVSAWQAASGITPAAGYFGPKSRAAVATMGGSTTGGTTGGTTTGGITTPGVEGTLTVTSAPVSGGTVYEGDSKVTVLAFKAKAQTSDIALQRVKLNLGTATTIYNKIYSKVYVVDENGNTLASADLNSSTVVKDGSNYYITLAGFSYVVPKDTTKTLTIKMDVRSSVDSADLGSYTVQLSNDGVRGTDGAGIDQYSPVTGSDVSKATTVGANLADSASLTLSANVNNPLSMDVIAADGSADNELDKVTLLTFDIKATKDNVLLTDLVASVTRSAGTATASSTYLYVDGVQIGSASLSGSTATFSDIDYTISKDSTKTFMLKADIRSASSVVTTISASVLSTGMTGENTIGDNVTTGNKSGSATGNSMYVRNIGPEFTLVSSSATRTSVSSSDTTGVATSTGSATFNLNIKAVGGAISFGSVGSSTPMFATTSSTYVGVSKNGATAVSLSSLSAAGTSAVLSYGANPTGSTADTEGFTVPENATVSVPVTVSLTVAGNSANNYAFQLNGVRWYTAAAGQQESTSMTNQAAWRTSSISLP